MSRDYITALYGISQIAEVSATAYYLSSDRSELLSKTGKMYVQVFDKDVFVEKVFVFPQEPSLTVGQSLQLQTKLHPLINTNSAITWQSSNSAVITVNAQGKITAHAAGTAEITAINTAGNISGKTLVHVTAPVAIQALQICPYRGGVMAGGRLQLVAKILPDDATWQEVTWQVLNPSLAQIDTQSGLLTAKADSGMVKVVATSRDGKTAQAQIEILPLFSEAQIHLDIPQGQTMMPFVAGDKDQYVSWLQRSFALSKTEITGELWDKIYWWAKDNNYDSDVDFGYMGTTKLSESNHFYKDQPVSSISWYSAVIWCNAFTEWHNQTYGTNYTTVYNDGNTPNEGQPIRNLVVAEAKLKNFTNPDFLTGTGFRLPSVEEWEFAARYAGTVAENGGTCPVNTKEHSGHCYTKGNSPSGGLTHYLDANAVGEPAKSTYQQVAVVSSYLYHPNYPNTEPWKQDTTGVFATANVASRQSNYLGLYDMSGNVREWVFNTQPNSLGERRGTMGGWVNGFLGDMSIGVRVSGSNPKGNKVAFNFDQGLRVARTLP